MTMSATVSQPARVAESTSHWLKRYYFSRFAFSAVWVVVAFAVAKNVPALAAVMLVGYPAWDAIANYVDARRSGGLARNRAQLLNFVVSIVTAAAIAVALGRSMNSVLVVFGVWAGFAGVLQLATAVGRWKRSGAQWAMIPERSAVRARGNFHDQQGARRGAGRHRQHCALCRLRCLLLPRLCYFASGE